MDPVQITVADYFMGRDKKWPNEVTDAIRANAAETTEKVNKLLVIMAADGVQPSVNRASGTVLDSGWRSAEINGSTPGAAVHSKHMTGQAADMYDPTGAVDAWCMANQNKLADVGLWLESPASTPHWSHWQIVAPGSGHRVFIP